MSVRYYNTNGKFSHDKMIRSIVEKCGGTEIGFGQDPETHVRALAFDFGTEEERETARKALMAAGKAWKLYRSDGDDLDDEEPESTSWRLNTTAAAFGCLPTPSQTSNRPP